MPLNRKLCRQSHRLLTRRETNVDHQQRGRPSYTVSYDGVEVLRPSALGLTADYGDFTQGMKLVKATEKRIQVSYDMTRTKRAHVSYGANQLTLDMVNAKGFPLQITFNDAVVLNSEEPRLRIVT